MNEGVPFLLGRSFYHPPLPPPKKKAVPLPMAYWHPQGLQLAPPLPPQCCVLPYGMSSPPHKVCFFPPQCNSNPSPKRTLYFEWWGGSGPPHPPPPPPMGLGPGVGAGGGTLKSWDLSVCSAVCYGAGIRTRVPTVARPPGRQGALLRNEPEAPRGSSRK